MRWGGAGRHMNRRHVLTAKRSVQGIRHLIVSTWRHAATCITQMVAIVSSPEKMLLDKRILAPRAHSRCPLFSEQPSSDNL